MNETSFPWYLNAFLIVPLMTILGYFYASFRVGLFLPVHGSVFFILLVIGTMSYIPAGYLLLFRKNKKWDVSLPGTILLMIACFNIASFLELKVQRALHHLEPGNLAIDMVFTGVKNRIYYNSGEQTAELLIYSQIQFMTWFLMFLLVYQYLAALIVSKTRRRRETSREA